MTDITYSQASRNLSTYKETSVRWGGVIVDVENEENHTLLQVLSYPLNAYGRPQLNKQTDGRFVIKSSEFLDPAVYAKDREVTVAGTIKGDIERTIGKKTVRLPLVSSTAIHLWPVYYRNDPYFGYGYRGFGGYGYGYGYPYFGYGGYGSPFWGGYGPWGYGPYW